MRWLCPAPCTLDVRTQVSVGPFCPGQARHRAAAQWAAGCRELPRPHQPQSRGWRPPNVTCQRPLPPRVRAPIDDAVEHLMEIAGDPANPLGPFLRTLPTLRAPGPGEPRVAHYSTIPMEYMHLVGGVTTVRRWLVVLPSALRHEIRLCALAEARPASSRGVVRASAGSSPARRLKPYNAGPPHSRNPAWPQTVLVSGPLQLHAGGHCWQRRLLCCALPVPTGKTSPIGRARQPRRRASGALPTQTRTGLSTAWISCARASPPATSRPPL